MISKTAPIKFIQLVFISIMLLSNLTSCRESLTDQVEIIDFESRLNVDYERMKYLSFSEDFSFNNTDNFLIKNENLSVSKAYFIYLNYHQLQYDNHKMGILDSARFTSNYSDSLVSDSNHNSKLYLIKPSIGSDFYIDRNFDQKLTIDEKLIFKYDEYWQLNMSNSINVDFEITVNKRVLHKPTEVKIGFEKLSNHRDTANLDSLQFFMFLEDQYTLKLPKNELYTDIRIPNNFIGYGHPKDIECRVDSFWNYYGEGSQLILTGQYAIIEKIDFIDKNISLSYYTKNQDRLIDFREPEICNLTDTLVFSNLLSEHNLVHFWGTWCGPCLKNFPKLKSLKLQYPNLNFIGVNSEITSLENSCRTKEKFDLDWVNLGFVANDLEFDRLQNINAYPTYIVVDAKNNVLFRTEKIIQLEQYLKKSFN